MGIGILVRKGVNFLKVKELGLIMVVENKEFKKIVSFLKKSNIISSLVDLWCLDYIEREKRFEVNYRFLSFIGLTELVIKLSIKEKEGVETLTEEFKSSGWLEREVWDLVGVFFNKNLDLRRILTDYGFHGFPLRKDFPMTGYKEVRYDFLEKRIVTEKVEISGEMKFFLIEKPW